jgi:hypothetical protein
MERKVMGRSVELTGKWPGSNSAVRWIRENQGTSLLLQLLPPCTEALRQQASYSYAIAIAMLERD